MIFYAVVWVTWACPGGWFGGLIPPRVRPHLCQEGAELRLFGPRADAERWIDQLGQDLRPKLIEYRGLRRTDLPVTFRPDTRR